MVKQIVVRQRVLHPVQKDIVASTKKRKILITGRRVGKTTLAAYEAAEWGLKGKRVLFAAPTLDQIEFFWDECKRIFQEGIDAGIVYKHENKHLIILPNGGRIKAKTAWDADTLRGDFADLLILEEFAMMKEEAWVLVGAPMLMDNNGTAWFISTPKRRNHFHKMYLKGLTNERWDVFHATSHDNPHLSKEALADMMEDMTEDGYKQEIMAQFLEDQGMVFRNLDKVLVLEHNWSIPKEHKGHKIVAGIDWGKSGDFTAVSIGCATCKKELVLYRSKGKEYIYQRNQIEGFVDRWNIGGILAESNAMGEPIIEEMNNAGLPVTGFATTGSSKPDLIEGLELVCETMDWNFLKDDIGRTEMEAYEVTYGKHGHPKYEGASGVHDDTVIARALMVRKGNESSPQLMFT